MNKSKVVVLLILLLSFSKTVFAAEPPPEVIAQTAILGEASTGKIIYEKDMEQKMYPASMTKLITALVALDHLNPDALLTVGTEINEIPWDSSKAGHLVGETLTVKNLIRGLLIPSGNDSANVLAVAVARKVKNDETLPFEECINVFTELMNEKAKSLGATNSHFANAHGYHDENHYTTAHDMFFIAQEALKNQTIVEVAKEKNYTGDSAENTLESNGTLKTQNYNWTNHNLLITDNPYQYEYAIGLKTGFMDEAGDCLTAAAQKDGTTLISVVFHSEDPARWTDTTSLFEYGFNNFTMANLQKAGDVVNTVALSGHNRLLGDNLDTIIKEDINEYLLTEDIENLEKQIEYKSELIVESKKEEDPLQLKAPIEKDAEVGKIIYKLGNEVVRETNVYAATEVEKRTILNSIQYIFKNLTTHLFSVKGILTIVGIIAVIAALIGTIATIKSRRNRRRSRYIFKSNRRNRGHNHRYHDGPRMRKRRRR